MRKVLSVDAPGASVCFVIFLLGIIGTLCAVCVFLRGHDVSTALSSLADAGRTVENRDQILRQINNFQAGLHRQFFTFGTLLGVLCAAIGGQAFLWGWGGTGRRGRQMRFRSEKTLSGHVADYVLRACLNRRTYVLLFGAGALAAAAVAVIMVHGWHCCIVDLERSAARLADVAAIQEFQARLASSWRWMEALLLWGVAAMQGYILLSWLFCMLRISAFFRVEKSRISI